MLEHLLRQLFQKRPSGPLTASLQYILKKDGTGARPLTELDLGGGGGGGGTTDVSALLTTSQFQARVPTLGQKAAPASLPVVLPAEQVEALKPQPVAADTASAREATLRETRDAVRGLAPLLGSTDGLEALATANRDLLATLNTYNDGVESLLSNLNTNTDGLEGLLAALGVKDDNVLAKLEALRLLLAGALTVQGNVSVSNLPATQPVSGSVSVSNLPAIQPVSGTVRVENLPATQAVSAATLPLPTGAATDAKLEAVRALLAGTLSVQAAVPTTTASTLTIPAGASMSSAADLTGRSVVRLSIGASWTAADLTVQTSADGSVWYDLYDEYGAPYLVRAGANRGIFIAPGPFLAVNWVRLRSGTPAAPVNQSAEVVIRLGSVAL